MAAVPLAMLPIGLAGALGAALGGQREPAAARGRWPPLLGGGDAAARGGRPATGHPAGVAAVALSYGVYRAVLVVVDARLQDRIDSRSRATVTSVAGLGIEVATVRHLRGLGARRGAAVAALGVLIAAALPCLLRLGRSTRRGQALGTGRSRPWTAGPATAAAADQSSGPLDLRRRRHVGQQVGRRAQRAQRQRGARGRCVGRPGSPYIRRAQRGSVARASVATAEMASLRRRRARPPLGANRSPTAAPGLVGEPQLGPHLASR